DFFGVSVRTIANWQAKHEEFLQALKSGKEEADDRVERSLYQRAVGYEYDAVKVFNANGTPMIVPYRATMPPDVTAMIFWLKNRPSDRWRDVHKHEHGAACEIDRMSDEELRQYVAEEARALGIHCALVPNAASSTIGRLPTTHSVRASVQNQCW